MKVAMHAKMYSLALLQVASVAMLLSLEGSQAAKARAHMRVRAHTRRGGAEALEMLPTALISADQSPGAALSASPTMAGAQDSANGKVDLGNLTDSIQGLFGFTGQMSTPMPAAAADAVAPPTIAAVVAATQAPSTSTSLKLASSAATASPTNLHPDSKKPVADVKVTPSSAPSRAALGRQASVTTTAAVAGTSRGAVTPMPKSVPHKLVKKQQGKVAAKAKHGKQVEAPSTTAAKAFPKASPSTPAPKPAVAHVKAASRAPLVSGSPKSKQAIVEPLAAVNREKALQAELKALQAQLAKAKLAEVVHTSKPSAVLVASRKPTVSKVDHPMPHPTREMLPEVSEPLATASTVATSTGPPAAASVVVTSSTPPAATSAAVPDIFALADKAASLATATTSAAAKLEKAAATTTAAAETSAVEKVQKLPPTTTLAAQTSAAIEQERTPATTTVATPSSAAVKQEETPATTTVVASSSSEIVQETVASTTVEPAKVAAAAATTSLPTVSGAGTFAETSGSSESDSGSSSESSSWGSWLYTSLFGDPVPKAAPEAAVPEPTEPPKPRPKFTKQSIEATAAKAHREFLQDVAVGDGFERLVQQDDNLVQHVRHEDEALRTAAETPALSATPPTMEEVGDRTSPLTAAGGFWSSLAKEDGDIEHAVESGGDDLTEYARLTQMQDNRVSNLMSELNDRPERAFPASHLRRSAEKDA